VFHQIHIPFNVRAVLMYEGVPARALGPGHHRTWSRYEVKRWDTDHLTFTSPAALLAVLPADWYETVHVAQGQYGVLLRDERPVALLAPGVHRRWTVEANVTLRIYPESEPLPELTKELRESIAAGELTEISIERNARGVFLRNGVPERALEPGHHAFYGKHGKALVWNTDELVLTAQPDVLALFPEGWVRTVTLAPTQRAVVARDGRPMKFLRPGAHWVWTLSPRVTVETFDVTEAPPELTDELRAVVPAAELIEVQVRQFERGLKYVQGKFDAQLEPGKHLFWVHPGARVSVTVVDTRVQQLKVEGQELMTKDKVTLRLTITAEYAPTDAPTTVHAVADVKDALYLAVQLATREFVAGVTLDELLEGRDGLTRYLETQVMPRAEAFGLRVHRVGVKDVILPGEMKALLNKVIEAEKVAAANVILRREDAAATRNMANTAKVIAEHPVLMRLKELETMKEIAEKIDEIKLFMGADGLRGLLPLTANDNASHEGRTAKA
jgi:regulator of protease activity HflC (stomatin/prohibitin superfamily)